MEGESDIYYALELANIPLRRRRVGFYISLEKIGRFGQKIGGSIYGLVESDSKPDSLVECPVRTELRLKPARDRTQTEPAQKHDYSMAGPRPVPDRLKPSVQSQLRLDRDMD
jgi:hypothetical protein